MPSRTFPAPPVEPVIQQHQVADPANAARLLEAIPDRSELLGALKGKHIVSVRHFDPELTLQLFRAAANRESGTVEARPSMACKVMGAIFLTGSSPETQLSFKRAWKRMGGGFLDLGPAADEIVHSQRDPAEIAALANNYSDFAVLSTADAGLLEEVIKYAQVPVISAGDGDNEAPTQALADLYTIFKWRPDLLAGDSSPESRLQIGVFGNPSNTGSIKSLLYGLSLFPQIVDRIVLMERMAVPFSPGQREVLEKTGLRIATVAELCPHDTIMGGHAKIVPHLDLIYSHLKLQQTISRMDMLEFKGFFQPNLLLMSPHRQLPEFSTLVNNSPHNGFFAEAKAGVLLRTAVMGAVMAD